MRYACTSCEFESLRGSCRPRWKRMSSTGVIHTFIWSPPIFGIHSFHLPIRKGRSSADSICHRCLALRLRGVFSELSFHFCERSSFGLVIVLIHLFSQEPKVHQRCCSHLVFALPTIRRLPYSLDVHSLSNF